MPKDHVHGQTRLRVLLADAVDRASYDAVAAGVGVAKTSIENYIKERNRRLPEMETLSRYADYFHLPRWRIIEYAGWDLELPTAADQRVARLVQLAGRTPLLLELLDALTDASEEELRSFLLALEVVKHQQQRMIQGDTTASA